MKRQGMLMTAILLAAALVTGPAAAQSTYKRAAYLLCWNGGSFGGDTGGAIVESIMVDIFIRSLRGSYDKLHYCKGKQCTGAQVLKDLDDLQRSHEAVDFYLATHGIKDPTPRISVEPNFSSITRQDFLDKKQTWHRRHRLRAVMGMHCDGSFMLPTWTELGFDVAMGTRQINSAGWANVPLFMKFFRQRRCLFGGDCSRTFRQAMDLAWQLSAWIDPIYKSLNTISGNQMAYGYPSSRLDSTPVYAGDTDLRITSYRGVYNACNGQGDAHGFITPGDTCCLPGQTCDGFTYSCNGLASTTAQQIPTDLCTASGASGFSPDNECHTGSDCASKLCLVDEGGLRCARSCGGASDCYPGEACLGTVDANGKDSGKYCARSLTKTERSCICKNLKAASCGLAETSADPLTCSTDVSAAGAPGQGQKDLTLRFAVQNQTDWMSACGCEVSPAIAEKICCTPPLPREAAGCSLAPGAGSTAGTGSALVLVLVLICLLRRRQRRLSRPPPQTHISWVE